MAVPVEILTLAEKPVEQTSEFVGTVRVAQVRDRAGAGRGLHPQDQREIGRPRRSRARCCSRSMTRRSRPWSRISNRSAPRARPTRHLRGSRPSAPRSCSTAGAMSQQEVDQALALQRSTEATLKADRRADPPAEERIGLFARDGVGAPGVDRRHAGPRSGDRITRQTPLTTIEDNTGLELYLNVPVQEATAAQARSGRCKCSTTPARSSRPSSVDVHFAVGRRHHADGAGEDADRRRAAARSRVRSVRARARRLVHRAGADRAAGAP